MTKEEYNANPNTCKNCNKPILCAPNKRLDQTREKVFCCQSCSATYNNLNKEKKGYYCTKCGELLGYGYKEFGRKLYCENCNPNTIKWDTATLKEVKEKREYQKYSRIRALARKKFFKETNIKTCQFCGYDKHIEVCHIKGINEFPDNTTIAEINDLTNMIGLCPNCHWEFDNLPREEFESF